MLKNKMLKNKMINIPNRITINRVEKGQDIYRFEIFQTSNEDKKIILSFTEDMKLLSEKDLKEILLFMIEYPILTDLKERIPFIMQESYLKDYEYLMKNKYLYEKVINLLFIKLKVDTYKIIKAIYEEDFEFYEDWEANLLYKENIEKNNIVDFDNYKAIIKSIFTIRGYDIEMFLLDCFKDLPIKTKMLKTFYRIFKEEEKKVINNEE